jgi:hypothetical protein
MGRQIWGPWGGEHADIARDKRVSVAIRAGLVWPAGPKSAALEWANAAKALQCWLGQMVIPLWMRAARY